MALRLAELPEATFMIVGDGELRRELESSSEAQVLGERIKWTGFRRDVAAVLAASDVAVLTSDNEGTPVSLIEAQAAGVPVVATDVGGVSSAVRDGETGRVVPVGDEEGLATAVREFVIDAERAAGMGAAGRQHALSTFSLERLVADIDELYARLLEEKARDAA
jgi:glycosyltransferase involved in cell wall biosynthesis